MELIFSLQEIDTAASSFMSLFSDYKIVAVDGVMGAGKTTFIHAVCRQMKVTDKMSSPTYSIINQYKTIHGVVINHIDIYRLRDTEEAIQAGVEDVLNSGEICFIEWPEKIADILPLPHVTVFLSIADDHQRRLDVKFPRANSI